MKYLLIMHNNPELLNSLPPDVMDAIGKGHQEFIEKIRASGELIVTQALADPSTSKVVRTRDGERVVTDGPYLEAKEYLGGYYLIDVENEERALELAAMIPDAGIEGMGVEVRAVMFSHGADM
ncbi:Uncharacterized conserved protein [Pseudonocardia thermophila]|jgi:Uncharacterized protein conserved in bacteria|uniref:Uncharacterized conserved protein n=1 Tax=Pseudonocardia thermophila TaxID=1848 RepID=A0A1M6Q729_PSETH|nr:YciI family protein [Pseudonocardia thermophila]SHK15958.1 Uncharacterized conserved protein [Pseudonocardia thermophila]